MVQVRSRRREHTASAADILLLVLLVLLVILLLIAVTQEVTHMLRFGSAARGDAGADVSLIIYTCINSEICWPRSRCDCMAWAGGHELLSLARIQ